MPALRGRPINAAKARERAGRIFVALRHETRADTVTNTEIAQLLDLSDALATLLVDGDTREQHLAARACAAIDAQRAATGNLSRAIARVREQIDDLVR